MTLAATKEAEKHIRVTRKDEFLARMEGLMPWILSCVYLYLFSTFLSTRL